MFEIKGKQNTAQIYATSIEDEAITQIYELCNQEWIQGCKIAIMPDCHSGKGCTIGTTITIHDKVCPNLVGVDIGCGMLTVKLPVELNDLSLKKLDYFITNNIPCGYDNNVHRIYSPDVENLYLEDLRCYSKLTNHLRFELGIGSLGGGNHFIEIDEDNEHNKYLVIHSGSRNLGNQVAKYYQDLAYEDCNQFNKKMNQLIIKLKDTGREKEIETELRKFKEQFEQNLVIPKQFAYLEGNHLDDYLHDMMLCQRYAQVNRKIIAKRILEYIFKEKYEKGNVLFNQCFTFQSDHIKIEMETFETIHNYINPNDHILRKGAISAYAGEKVLIPINMRDGAIIGIGKGNPDYNYSGPHGAGRLMSRSIAKEKISMDEFKESMKSIYSTSITRSTIDESPMAYKPINEIIENIQDSIEVVKIIKPIYNFKAH